MPTLYNDMKGNKMAHNCWNKISVVHSDPAMIRKAALAFNDGTLLGFFCNVQDDIRGLDWWEREEKYMYVFGDDVDVDVKKAVKNKCFDAYFVTFFNPPIIALEKANELGFEIRNYYYATSAEPGKSHVGEYAGIWQDGYKDEYNIAIRGVGDLPKEYSLENVAPSLWSRSQAFAVLRQKAIKN